MITLNYTHPCVLQNSPLDLIFMMRSHIEDDERALGIVRWDDMVIKWRVRKYCITL